LLLTNNLAPPSRRAIYRYFKEAGEAGVDICLITLADFLATYAIHPPQDLWISHLETVRALLDGWWEQAEVEISPVLFLNGNDLQQLLGLNPGPEIGKLLDQLREAQAIGEVSGREEAILFIRRQLENKNHPG
jgi:hypothetical protein